MRDDGLLFLCILVCHAAVFQQQVVMTLASALLKVSLSLFKELVMHRCQDTPGAHVSLGVLLQFSGG